jgi:Mg-chelatase subunit ChlD
LRAAPVSRRVNVETFRASTCAVTIAAALALSPSSVEAGGDEVHGTRGGEQLSEREHGIELTFERGYAKLRVRRTVHNGIERHDEAQLWITLPEGAVATGLRTLGEHNGKPKWFDADLLEAEAAAARYQELTGLGGYYPKDPALLSWRDQTHLALQVFPVAPGTDKTVEYTLEMPAFWADGRWQIELPSLGTEALPAQLVINPANTLDQLFVDGEVVARGSRLTLDHEVSIALAPRDPAPFSLALASADTGQRHLAHWRLSLAPKISTIPSKARIVLIFDRSRSMGDDQLDSQRRVALTYLEHFADPSLAAEVALLAFDREVHALSNGFVSVAEATRLLDQPPMRQRNGSEVGLALASADALLNAGRQRGPRRIVLFSDFETASRLTPETLQATAEHSKAIIHLATTTTASDVWLERDDGHGWAPLAAATQGVMWTAAAPEQWRDDDQHRDGLDVFEELARPVRIDHLAVRVAGFDLDDDSFLDYGYINSLDEGEGLDELALSNTAVTKLIVEGMTWNTPIHQTAKPSRELSDRWAALVFGTDWIFDLEEDEMMKLARRGKAVSPVTSYLAIEPGVRPSTEGITLAERGLIGSGSLGGRGGGSAGLGSGFGTGPVFDKRAWLESTLRDGWARCGGAGIDAEITLETRTSEILDLALTQAATDPALRGCMEQVAWSVELPGHFSAPETWTISL